MMNYIASMKLKTYLVDRGISQRKFSEILGIHYMYLNMIINRKRRPSPSLAARIEKETDGAINFRELLLDGERGADQGREIK